MSMSDLPDRITRLEHGPSDEPVIPAPEVVGFFVQWVRALRQWKQSTLADFARISVSTIERGERGEKVSDEGHSIFNGDKAPSSPALICPTLECNLAEPACCESAT